VSMGVHEGDVTLIRRVTWIGMALNVLLAALKFLVGILGSSHAVVADAVHSLSDMVTDVAVILGVRFWSAPADSDHPYGHQRIEALITALVGLILASVAVGLVYNALGAVGEERSLEVGWIALVGPALSLFVKEALYRWTVKVGARVRSSAVVANAWHHRSDALSSIPALVAVVMALIYPEWAFVDQIGAVIVAMFILKVSWDIIRPALHELTDGGACEESRRKIGVLAMTVEGVKGVHAIRTRRYGSDIYVDLHVLVEPELSVRSGHAIAGAVKAKLIDQGPGVVDVVVHVEPDDPEMRRD